MNIDEMKDRIARAEEIQRYTENRCEVLEKENAELKGIKDVATLIRANNDTVITLMQLNNMLVSRNQQLTKAKEIINEFLDFESSCMERGIYISDKIRTEAKQFLNEVEK